MKYICTNTNLGLDTDARGAGDWYKVIKAKQNMTFNQVIPYFKELLKKGDFKVADKKVLAAAKKAKALNDETDSVSGLTVNHATKDDLKIPHAYFRPIKYQVSDPDDPHHYKWVEEEFKTEAERDRRVIEIKADKLKSYLGKNRNFGKYSVSYWQQID